VKAALTGAGFVHHQLWTSRRSSTDRLAAVRDAVHLLFAREKVNPPTRSKRPTSPIASVTSTFKSWTERACHDETDVLSA